MGVKKKEKMGGKWFQKKKKRSRKNKFKSREGKIARQKSCQKKDYITGGGKG